MRMRALAQVGSFRPDLVSGEEPELCHRLQAANWRIWLLPQGVAIHDAAITRFSQWWMRAVRSGYGCIQGTRLYGGMPNHSGVRPIARAWFSPESSRLAEGTALIDWNESAIHVKLVHLGGISLLYRGCDDAIDVSFGLLGRREYGSEITCWSDGLQIPCDDVDLYPL